MPIGNFRRSAHRAWTPSIAANLATKDHLNGPACGGVRWAQVPAPKGQRRVVASEPVAPSVPVATVAAVRDAELTRPDEDTRRVSFSGQRSTDPAERPPTRDEVAAALFPTDHIAEDEPATLIGFWHLSTLRNRTPAAAPAELRTLADRFGVESSPIPGGIETDPNADRIALAEFHRRIGFVPLALTRRRSVVPPPLPVAEAYELWKRWQEDTEPPAAVYDQIALEGVA
jgi:hypothetical protein